MRYYFHIRNDIETLDPEGEELANLAAAHFKAIEYARDLASAAVHLGKLDLKHRIDVETDTGDVLLSVAFGDVIEVSN